MDLMLFESQIELIEFIVPVCPVLSASLQCSGGPDLFCGSPHCGT